MRHIFNSVLILGGLAGAVIGFLSEVIVNSSFSIINGLDLSLVLGFFCVIAFIQGIVNLILSD